MDASQTYRRSQERLSVRAQSRSRRRPGVVYVAVMGAAMVISIITLAALHITKVELRATGGVDQTTAAINASRAAVEFALAKIRSNSNWRTAYTSGQEEPAGSWTTWTAASKFKFSLVDDDGNLADNDRDYVAVRGIGSAGRALVVTEVQLEPSGAAITSLDVALHAHGDVNINVNSSCDQFVSSNDDVIIGGLLQQLDGDAWAADDVAGSVTGTQLENGGTKELPDADHVFKYYRAVGTWIDIASIPGRKINQALISPTSNPYGAANPQGIYVIDCQNQSLTIANSQIKATIVLLNANNPDIDDQINWEPPAPHTPALMVQGNLTMRWDGGTNVVGSLLGILGGNSTPMPGIIKGPIYVTGNLVITSACVLQGPVIVGGEVTVNSPLTLTYGGIADTFPPPGFSKGPTMRIVPGTWRRTTR
jgi:hypothetical protein